MIKLSHHLLLPNDRAIVNEPKDLTQLKQKERAFETRLERARDCAMASPGSTFRLILFLW